MCKLDMATTASDSRPGSGPEHQAVNLAVNMANPADGRIALHSSDVHANNAINDHAHLFFDDPYRSKNQDTIAQIEQKLATEIHLLEQILKQLAQEIHSHDHPTMPPSEKPPVKTPPVDKPPIDKPPIQTPIDKPIHGGHITNPDALAAMKLQNDFNGRGIHKPPHAVAPGKYGTGDGHSEAVFPNLVGFRQWGVIMAEDPNNVNRNVKSSVKDAAVYYHLKTGGWVQAHAPEQPGFWQGNYRTDFHNNEHQRGDWKHMPDGSYQFSFAPPGMLNHFGPGKDQIPYDPNLYDGVYDTMAVKANVPNSGLVMQLGGDWLRSVGIKQSQEGPKTRATVQNPAAGGTNWMPITDVSLLRPN
ncbi:MAG: hypothetical protein JSS83_28845 [Cyanobacteria bacterium SZAS LIN-3]|nr:hypothetical protein [Cyanobacteria bacterium SZAS LIN-3]